MMDPAQQKKPLDTSKFYMWRCLLAIAWADGECGPEETEYFGKVFDNLPRFYDMTQEQCNALADDLVTARKIDGLLSHINDPEVRGTLLGFARDLVALDGITTPGEDDILKRLHIDGIPMHDNQNMRTEIREVIKRQDKKSAEEIEKLRMEAHLRNPFFATLDNLLLQFGIDLLDK